MIIFIKIFTSMLLFIALYIVLTTIGDALVESAEDFNLIKKIIACTLFVLLGVIMLAFVSMVSYLIMFHLPNVIESTTYMRCY